MKKIFVLMSVVLLLLCTACSGRYNAVSIYYASSGGSASAVDFDGIDTVPTGRSWPDPKAKAEKQLDFLGMTLEGNYTNTFQSSYRTTRDEYERIIGDKYLRFAVDRRTSQILSYHYNYTRKYTWPEDRSSALLTEKECLDIANGYLEKYTELYSEYSLTDTIVDNPHLPNWPVSYNYIYDLKTEIYCNRISVVIRSDGELTDISQYNYIDSKTYKELKKVDPDRLYNIAETAIRKKLGNKYDDYYIERIDDLTELALSSAGGSQIAVTFNVSADADDPYPSQLIVFVPVKNCTAR